MRPRIQSCYFCAATTAQDQQTSEASLLVGAVFPSVMVMCCDVVKLGHG